MLNSSLERLAILVLHQHHFMSSLLQSAEFILLALLPRPFWLVFDYLVRLKLKISFYHAMNFITDAIIK